ncbi:tRNA (adenosine(37)-N6)-threonylcarbamoyltransferase complex ATPase subunit type 1 TsaE [Culicoidibacter larvae]|uniref:tRNA threonylcarbamoyladenosine biosynthesis protein TsaE n=1 Tax=Culicoidibacter larvae TaxID=2579976 RepID=A0A5R8QBF8_9FIRM|nr:tRNA (adenosine(37)-N6)-threonylcarbamoyltransferase complex ATPase subunit type 1 TsaE [Culicoidibacter larvae]TLG73911.1 tRNA (adenosine(37)-N6)-threonylcarbamoyltransferase complex ATPase subunit type 1 TsaE [Culicoidibacter larvae]
MRFENYTEKEVAELAAYIGRHLERGAVLLLTGDLGAGKTTFTRYLARSLNITERVTSPTFTLIKEYDEGRFPLYHIDAYRADLDSDAELLEEYIYGDGVTVIEWPSCIEELLPKTVIALEFLMMDEQHRTIVVTVTDTNYQNLFEERV